MELWGASLSGDPCRECRFEWSLSADEALTWISGAPDRFAELSRKADGDERGVGWSVSEYVSHVADNLRQWAERVQGARLAGRFDVAGYDPDELASARVYAAVPLEAALWSLNLSVDAWLHVMRSALAEGVQLQHATRGLQRAEDIVRNNTHDAHHHLWDIRGILSRR